MAQAFAFVIEELTGSKRTVSLEGRALPYRPVEWSGQMRFSKTWYPGNPAATLQTLGPDEGSTEINGMWKDRFIGGQVTVTGFPEVNTAQQLVEIFDELRLSGNFLRVQWGPYTRRGLLASFAARPDRVEDISWTASFEWVDRDRPVIRAATPTTTTSQLRQASNSVDDQLAFEPPDVSPNYKALIVSRITAVRDQVGTVFDAVRDVQSALNTPAEVLGALASAVETIQVQTEFNINALLNTPYETVRAIDRVQDVLSTTAWSKSVARSASALRGVAQRQERDTQQQARPGQLKFVTVAEGTTLRDISLQEYGTSDSWQYIADANGYEGSAVPAGDIVIVPPPPVETSGQRDANTSSQR